MRSAVLRDCWHLIIDARIRTFSRVVVGSALCALVVAVGFLAATLLCPSAALSTFAFNAPRSLQVESAPASVMWLGTFLRTWRRPGSSFLTCFPLTDHPSATAATPCTASGGTVPPLAHVVVIGEENESYTSVLGNTAQASYLNGTPMA